MSIHCLEKASVGVVQSPIGAFSWWELKGKVIKTSFKDASEKGNASEYIRRQIEEYFSGKRRMFEIELHYISGTPLEQKVWGALMEVPYGTTVTYSQIAQRIGIPRAARFVGNACAKNMIPLIIPCHRVVSTSGIGGFSGDIKWKLFLLRLEGSLGKGQASKKVIKSMSK